MPVLRIATGILPNWKFASRLNPVSTFLVISGSDIATSLSLLNIFRYGQVGSCPILRDMANTATTRAVHEKWGAALNMFGFQAVPNILLSAQCDLRLSTTDIVVLLHLNRHWWSRDRAPYPRPMLIAEKMGVHRRTVERSLERMEAKGLIERLKPRAARDANVVRPISLIPLATKLGEIAGGSDSLPPAKDTQSSGSLLASSSEDCVFR